jgi:uncharacterized protein YggT (Ycf19 family)
VLVGILNFLFNVVLFLVNVAGWLLIVYEVMTLILPENKYTQLVGKYIEPVLSPIRAWLGKTFPKLGGLRLDFSPVVLWLLLEIAGWLLKLLQNILL